MREALWSGRKFGRGWVFFFTGNRTVCTLSVKHRIISVTEQKIGNGGSQGAGMAGETRSTKPEIRNKFKIQTHNDKNVVAYWRGRLRVLGLDHSPWFRVSIFGLRICLRRRRQLRQTKPISPVLGKNEAPPGKQSQLCETNATYAVGLCPTLRFLRGQDARDTRRRDAFDTVVAPNKANSPLLGEPSAGRVKKQTQFAAGLHPPFHLHRGQDARDTRGRDAFDTATMQNKPNSQGLAPAGGVVNSRSTSARAFAVRQNCSMSRNDPCDAQRFRVSLERSTDASPLPERWQKRGISFPTSNADHKSQHNADPTAKPSRNDAAHPKFPG